MVDDHQEVVHLLAMLLRSNGYQVVEAGSVADAVEHTRLHGPAGLVITDIGLADGNGADLIAQLGHPVARTLFTSGHPRTRFDGTPAAVPPDAVFLQKPFAPAVLMAIVRELLGAMEDPSPGEAPHRN